MPEAAQAKRPSPAPTSDESSTTESLRTDGEHELGQSRILDTQVRSFVEPSVGMSLAQVTVHTGPEAHALARQRGARAVTSGTRIAFAAGQYRPGSLDGDALLAHELAHVVQQDGASTPLATSQVAPAEQSADQAAARALLSSGRHHSEIAARTGIDPSTVDPGAVGPARPRRGAGLALQGCVSEPEYGTSHGGEAPTSLTDLHRGSRPENLTSDSVPFDSELRGFHAVIDGDGDQSAELDLVFRSGTTGALGAVDRVDVAATRLGNTPDRSGPGTESHSVSFDTAGQSSERRLHPYLRRRTDGQSPTEIEATGGTYTDHAKLAIHPPPPDGLRATYRMVMTKPVQFGPETTSEEHSVTFSRDPSDIYPVFVPNTPRRAGPIWVVDAQVGRYGDRYRFTFRRHGLLGTVRLGISPMAGTTPIGISQIDVPVLGPLDVRIVRNIGPVIELDLNGDGRTDIRMYQRLEPQPDYTSSFQHHQPEQFRQLTITVTDGSGSRVLGRSSREVRNGEYEDDYVHLPTEFESLAAAAAPEAFAAAAAVPDLATDLAGTHQMLRQLRHDAADAAHVSPAVVSTYETLVTRWLEVAKAPAGGVGPPARQAAAAARAFDAVFTAETAAATVTTYSMAEGASDPPEVKNQYTGRWRGTEDYGQGGYLDHDDPTYANRLAAALDVADRARAARLMTQMSDGLDRWVAHKLRQSGRQEDAQRAESLSALARDLDSLADKQTVRAMAVFHSAPEYVARGAPAGLPMRLYYWKEGSTWFLRDLTHPTSPSSQWTLRSSGGSATEPPHELFAKLNDKQRYPKGVIQYQLPGENGRADSVSVTHPWTVSEVLNWISLGLAAAALVAGMVVSGGTLATVVIPSLWAASAATGAAGAVVHMVEEHDQGRLTAGTIVLDVAQVIGSLAGGIVAGGRAVTAYRMGRAVTAARATGVALTGAEALQLEAVSASTLRVLLVTQIGTDVMQVVLTTDQLITQFRQIENSGMSDGDKLRAKMLLVAQAGAMAGLSFVSIRSTMVDLDRALTSGGRLIQAGSITIVPGMYEARHYQLEIEQVVGAGVAAPVRIVPPDQMGSSLALARIEFVGGRPQLAVVDGAPLSVVREEALHLQQLALVGRPRAGLTAAERRIQDAARQVTTAQGRWSSLSPTARLRAHQARLTLEEDAQLDLIRRYQGEIAAGRPVNPFDAENAWQNLENIRQMQARMAGAEARIRAGTSPGDIHPDLASAPSLFSKATVQLTPIDDAWRNLSEPDFVRAYTTRYPDSTLTAAELRQRFQMGRRLNPATGRLIDPSARVPDVRASYVAGSADDLPMQGTNRTRLEAPERTRIDALLAERDAARQAREAAPEASKERHLAQYRMNEASRQLGEYSAGMWVRRRYPGPPAAELIYPRGGGSRPGDFDQVWKCTVTDAGQTRTVWIVVEAKGGSSPLGSRQTTGGRAEQGTRLYFDDILRLMGAMGGDAQLAAERIRVGRAAADQSVRYVHVTAPIGPSAGTGTPTSLLGDISIREFDITPRGAVPSTPSTSTR